MRYFIGFMITIGLIIVLILLLFSGGGSKDKKVPLTAKTLTSYANTTAQARLTIDGPTNANQVHSQVRVTVDNNNTTFDLIQGYEGDVVRSQSYASNENAYSAFLHALTTAGFTKGVKNNALKDERGYCPLGDRYVFELIDGGNTIERYWATSCGKPKTYLGNTNLTLELFKAQIPDYNDLIENANL